MESRLQKWFRIVLTTGMEPSIITKKELLLSFHLDNLLFVAELQIPTMF